MATAGTTTIAQVRDVVAGGAPDPEMVVTPSIYVDRVVPLRRLRRPSWSWQPYWPPTFRAARSSTPASGCPPVPPITCQMVPVWCWHTENGMLNMSRR
ncbi:hypothetical protein [Mycobacterium sp. 852013-50091_SCH5140682]|uniref:hypothetical protein n=1 Tax=Mycobacterium sp. 852013-50091_SCH5140682 TaxID=1834109 RepID=UPI0025704F6D|nr:hypothetical protein [Mycobacterium sp. 852013-50091_SCH5140682]